MLPFEMPSKRRLTGRRCKAGVALVCLAALLVAAGRPPGSDIRKQRARAEDRGADEQSAKEEAEGPQTPTRALPFRLEDQFREIHEFRWPQEKVMVLFLADKSSARRAEKWIDPLYDKYKDRIQMEGVGVGRGVPRWQRGLIRFIVRQATDIPLMLDWTSEVAEAYGYAYRKPNLYLIAEDGRIAKHIIGDYCEEGQELAYAVLDKLLTPGSAPPETE